MLPDCAARDTILERAAVRAEMLEDMDSAWGARCEILGSASAHEAPRFENLFLCLAWCLAVSDRDPHRFKAARVLWQYKWVATAAPEYASVPRSVLERLIDDLEGRFLREGWGRRAGLHKRVELFQALGELDKARALLDEWRSAPRDRGSDCSACEASSLAELLFDLGEIEQGLREARPIVLGRLSCATVPHSTFGELLLPLVESGLHEQARDCYEKGRRLVASMNDHGTKLSIPYLVYAAFSGDIEYARSALRFRLPQAVALRSDRTRVEWFGLASVALDWLAERGVESLELPAIAGVVHSGDAHVRTVSDACRTIALEHAEALDRRNGNRRHTMWLESLPRRWRVPA